MTDKPTKTSSYASDWAKAILAGNFRKTMREALGIIP